MWILCALDWFKSFFSSCFIHFIVVIHMQVVDRWLYYRLKLLILNSLVLRRTNWTNSIDDFYLTNANWIRTHYSTVHRIYCTSMDCFHCGILYARNKEFDPEIRYHRIDTEAFVCHDVRLIQRPITVPFPMYRSMWLHHLMWLPQLPMGFAMSSHCMHLIQTVIN